MVAPVTVREKDLRALLGIVGEDRGDLPPHGLPLSLLTDLMGQIRCDQVTLVGLDSSEQMILFAQDALPEEGQDDGQAFWDNYWDCDHCSSSDRSGDLRSVTKASDYYSARQWHSTGMYTDYLRPHGTEHELLMLLPAGPGPAAGPGRTVRLLFSRGPGPDFSERDRAPLALLRPHLHQAYLDAERRRRGTPAADPPALGTAVPGRRRAHQRPDRPAAWRIERNGAHPPAKHLHQAARVQPHRRGHPRLPRPGSRVTPAKRPNSLRRARSR